MKLEWDDSKSSHNLAKHGLGFESAYEFAWQDAVLSDRSRHIDGEKRYAAIGWLYGKLYTVIFTRREQNLRIISLRRANKKEETYHEENETFEA